ncbi:guanylate kinase [Spiroplasma melliferum]|uniref:Guanylate kinase n=2 Tax=Spiroplasma melliferum TaxID=2134 RepID=A0AAI9T2F1_SPIME|nr:guanylate kinase [Spiroplasma melliferum]ELL44335.1 guanylate kinase [Spiroplasma melliferum IPMB4A]KAI92172.1 guanylate kinase [Spiroplasma melliferum KC3]QCO23586.1 guanylate kinase [Spiroplasma melliferum]
MQKKGFLIIFSGPSGVGKGTICQELFKYEELNLAYSVSMTTRAKRQDEVEGVNYFFVDRPTFETAIKNDELLEYAEFVGNYYGTPKSYCIEQINNGKNVLLEIEVQGATQVLQKVTDAVSIFLIPPSLEELEKRIRGRKSEPEEVLQARLAKAADELPLQSNYNYVVVNNTVEQAVAEIKTILEQEIANRS